MGGSSHLPQVRWDWVTTKADPVQGAPWVLAVLLFAPKQDSSNDLCGHRGDGKAVFCCPFLLFRACSHSDWLCSPEQRLMLTHRGCSFIFCLTLQLSQGFKQHFHYSVAVVKLPWFDSFYAKSLLITQMNFSFTFSVNISLSWDPKLQLKRGEDNHQKLTGCRDEGCVDAVTGMPIQDVIVSDWGIFFLCYLTLHWLKIWLFL